MADEPSLPPLPAVTWDAGSQTLSRRKRVHGDTLTDAQLFSNSSDPAVFSSDDDPNADNYVHGKRHKKKWYVGSWYQQNLASSDSAFSEDKTLPQRSQRTFERHFDSGVWMGSDSSIETDGCLPEPSEPEPKMPQLPLQPALPKLERFVREKIQDCIDEAEERVDLSGLGLEEISNQAISQLAEFVCIPTVAEDVPFEQTDPALQLYLAANPLTSVPGAIFHLEFLSVLSLRNTHITHLPSTIRNLTNLTSLNLSLCQLRYLPGELMDLLGAGGQLTDLKVHPNPFWKPDLDPDDLAAKGVAPVEECPVSFPCVRTSFVIRSPVQESDSRGVVTSKFRLPALSSTADSRVEVEADLLATKEPAAVTDEVAHRQVPSLFELALRSCSRSRRLRELASYLEPVSSPQVLSAFDQVASRAERNADDGHIYCSMCGESCVMPTTQWVEWRQIFHISSASDMPAAESAATPDLYVPFLRRGCSWVCRPQ